MSNVNYRVYGFVKLEGQSSRKPVEGISGKMTINDAIATADELQAKIKHMTFLVLDDCGRERYITE